MDGESAMSPRAIGPFREYPTGTVYRDGEVVGHRAYPDVPLLSHRGAGCGEGWRLEVDSAACREFDELEGRTTS